MSANGADLRKSHDEMAQFLLRMLRYSDSAWKGKRVKIVEAHYQEALRLVKQAGFAYRGGVDVERRGQA